MLGGKELAKLPITVQRFRRRLMAYSYDISYTPGNELVLADALSCAPLTVRRSFEVGKSLVVCKLVRSLLVSHHRMERIKAALCEDYEAKAVY